MDKDHDFLTKESITDVTQASHGDAESRRKGQVFRHGRRTLGATYFFPNAASLARTIAWARSATWSFVRILET